jgi:hypothetical protein
MPDKQIKAILEEWRTPHLPRRLPDDAQTRRALTQAGDLWRYRPRKCARCGDSFLVRGHSGFGCYVSYCSHECQQANRNEQRAEQRERERQRRQRKPIKCARCGKRVPPERSTRRYCSDACRQAAYRQRQAAE